MAESTKDNPGAPIADHPPGSSLFARRIARRALAPVERFLAIEAASGIVLLGAAAIALVWANSPWRPSYEALWHASLGFYLGPISIQHDLRFWINEGMMTIFFLVVGLEIRRELQRGELSEVRRAALPIAAAIGGMLVPACIFLALNRGQPGARGWGVPMATDIAFAVGVLALLGKRVPEALRIFVLALAVIDDVGAILVIALFYSSGLALGGFLVLLTGLAALLLLQMLGVRNPLAYVIPAAVLWAGTYAAGVHPTLAGVVIGFMTPANAWSGRESVSPLEQIQQTLHGWVAFGIMPLFALANAGVVLGGPALDKRTLLVFSGVGLGLLLGKPLGILSFSWLAVRFKIASLPRGIGWPAILLAGLVGGIGFTMALFIAHLAFLDSAALETAKLAIVLASGSAACAAFIAGRLLLAPKVARRPIARSTETETPA